VTDLVRRISRFDNQTAQRRARISDHVITRYRHGSPSDAGPAERTDAQRSFDRENVRVNLDRMPLALAVLAILHLLHVVVFFAMVTADGSRDDTWRIATGSAHGVMVPFALVSARLVRRVGATASRWSLLPPIYAAIYMTFGAIVTALDQIAAATPIAYVITAVGLALFFRLRKRESVAVFRMSTDGCNIRRPHKKINHNPN